MYRITKRFNGYPAAHRQPNHAGHCSLIHGHNWDFEITLVAEQLDKCGFVFDFGHMGFIKDYLKKHFDHTLLINQDDPYREYFINQFEILPAKAGKPRLANVIVCEYGCSSEGISRTVYSMVERWVSVETDNRVHCETVKVYEDGNNSARFPK